MALIDNCFVYYKLDTNNTTQPDATGNGNSGTIVGASFTSSGKINSGYMFDGVDDYFERTSILNTSNPFSINLWTKPTTLSTGGGQERIISIGASAVGKLRVYKVDGKLRLQTIGVVSANSTSTMTITDFTMLTLRYDGSDFYLDIKDSTNTETITINDASFVSGTSETVRFMRDISGSGANDGVLDEVGMWSEDLSSAERTELYNSGDGLQYPFTPVIGTSKALSFSSDL